MKLFKKLLAEFFGSFVLALVTWATVTLTNGNALITAIMFGLTFIGLNYSVGQISGGHLNPAVSLAMACEGRITWPEFFIYLIGQCLGAAAGTFAIYGASFYIQGGEFVELFKVSGFEYVSKNPTNNMITTYLTYVGIVAALSCIFIYIFLAVTDGNSRGNKKSGVIIGFSYIVLQFLAMLLGVNGFNPTNEMAVAVTKYCLGISFVPLRDCWVFAAGAIIGAILAIIIYNLINYKRVTLFKTNKQEDFYDLGEEAEVEEEENPKSNKKAIAPVVKPETEELEDDLLDEELDSEEDLDVFADEDEIKLEEPEDILDGDLDEELEEAELEEEKQTNDLDLDESNTNPEDLDELDEFEEIAEATTIQETVADEKPAKEVKEVVESPKAPKAKKAKTTKVKKPAKTAKPAKARKPAKEAKPAKARKSTSGTSSIAKMAATIAANRAIDKKNKKARTGNR